MVEYLESGYQVTYSPISIIDGPVIDGWKRRADARGWRDGSAVTVNI
jgi:hypothetical protein